MFIVVAHIENQEERQNELLHFIMQSCRDSQIHLMFNQMLAEYVKDEDERVGWAIEGAEIGRAAWKVSLSTYDFEMNKVVLNVAFLSHMWKTAKNRKRKIEMRKSNIKTNNKVFLAN